MKKTFLTVFGLIVVLAMAGCQSSTASEEKTLSGQTAAVESTTAPTPTIIVSTAPTPTPAEEMLEMLFATATPMPTRVPSTDKIKQGTSFEPAEREENDTYATRSFLKKETTIDGKVVKYDLFTYGDRGFKCAEDVAERLMSTGERYLHILFMNCTSEEMDELDMVSIYTEGYYVANATDEELEEFVNSLESPFMD